MTAARTVRERRVHLIRILPSFIIRVDVDVCQVVLAGSRECALVCVWVAKLGLADVVAASFLVDDRNRCHIIGHPRLLDNKSHFSIAIVDDFDGTIVE